MSRPYIGDADANYVRMSLEDFGKVSTILKSVGYDMQPGRRNGRGPTKLYRLTKQPSDRAKEIAEKLGLKADASFEIIDAGIEQARLQVLNELAARYRVKGYSVPGILNDFIAELERK